MLDDFIALQSQDSPGRITINSVINHALRNYLEEVTPMENAKLYTTWGPVRGDCGHVHRSLDAAEACLNRDGRECKSAGGYSDREVRVITSRDEIESYDVTRGPGKTI